jgi:hypothetical protein
MAVGLAVPCVEAWYSFGLRGDVGEAQWKVALETRKFPYDVKQLKEDVYGTYFSLERETTRAIEEATRLAQNLQGLELHFPWGFGGLARDMRSWRTN